MTAPATTPKRYTNARRVLKTPLEIAFNYWRDQFKTAYLALGTRDEKSALQDLTLARNIYLKIRG